MKQLVKFSEKLKMTPCLPVRLVRVRSRLARDVSEKAALEKGLQFQKQLHRINLLYFKGIDFREN